MTRLRPLGDRVVVRPGPAEEKTTAGLFIPDTAQEKPLQGSVVSAGPGRTENGHHVAMTVKSGDEVLFGKYSGTEITLDGEELLIVREDDILGIVDH